jgi:uncharacterized protein YegP (UPF0339 family)
MKFYPYKDDAGEWRWRFKAKNGAILGDSSEGYKNKGDCLSAIKSMVLACVKAQGEDDIIASE